MFNRSRPARLIHRTLAVAVLSAAAVAWAGGVAVSLDSILSTPEAGVAFTVGFTVYSMHTGEPEGEFVPEVRARSATMGESITVEARPEGPPGHFAATLTFPAAGEWQWEIQPFGKGVIDYPVSIMAPLQVRGTETPNVVRTMGDAERGHDLFLNKACISCHVNTRVEGNTAASLGPNLSTYRNDAAFLRRWLADPRAVRAGTLMPNLQLTESEIEDLIAFLNGPGQP